MLDDIVYSLNFEVQVSHQKERMNDLFMKKDVFSRVMKLIEKVHENQTCKDTFSRIVNPGFKMNQSKDIFYNYLIVIEDVTLGAMRRLLENLSNTTDSFFGFCKEVKTYQQTKFLTKSYLDLFQESKKKYLARSFAKDLFSKIETASCSWNPSVTQLNLFQAVPESLQGSYFFKTVQNL